MGFPTGASDTGHSFTRSVGTLLKTGHMLSELTTTEQEKSENGVWVEKVFLKSVKCAAVSVNSSLPVSFPLNLKHAVRWFVTLVTSVDAKL